MEVKSIPWVWSPWHRWRCKRCGGFLPSTPHRGVLACPKCERKAIRYLRRLRAARNLNAKEGT